VKLSSTKEIEFLWHCAAIYRELSRHAARFGLHEKEAQLAWLQFIGEFAWWNHPGRYADGALENIAVEAGQMLDSLIPPTMQARAHREIKAKPTQPVQRHLLHVATTLYHIGGHTRLILNWAKTDTSSRHSLAVLNQGAADVPARLQAAIDESGGQVFLPRPDAGLLAKAAWLRRLAQVTDVDAVVLHQHPHDIVPVVALATSNCPPVALLNHADHVFWFGSSVADTIINIRQSGARISHERRFAKDTSLLPVPLESKPHPLTRPEARNALGIPEEHIMLLTIGSAGKYQPTPTHDFFRTTRQVLEQNPEAHLYFIGVSAADAAGMTPHSAHPRLHFCGIIENPVPYQVAADLYLEGFPFGSLTALLEVALLGVPPVLALAPTSAVLATDDVALDDLISNAPNESSYIEAVNYLIRHTDERERRGEEIKRRVADFHYGAAWRTHLSAIYDKLARLKHEPRLLPVAPFGKTVDDTSLSAFHFHSLKNEPSLAASINESFMRSCRAEDLTRLLTISLATNDTHLSYKEILYVLRHHLTIFSSPAIARMAMRSAPLVSGTRQHLESWCSVFKRYEGLQASY